MSINAVTALNAVTAPRAPSLGGWPRGIAALAASLLVAASLTAWRGTDAAPAPAAPQPTLLFQAPTLHA